MNLRDMIAEQLEEGFAIALIQTQINRQVNCKPYMTRSSEAYFLYVVEVVSSYWIDADIKVICMKVDDFPNMYYEVEFDRERNTIKTSVYHIVDQKEEKVVW